MIPQNLYAAVSDAPVTQATPVPGGSINEAFHLQLADGTHLFLKRNTAAAFPGMFDKEAQGLSLLRNAGAPVPGFINQWEEAAFQYLLLEYILPASLDTRQWREAGRTLANLHRHTAERFGLDHPNYMGSLVQENTPCENFTSFFAEYRLGTQLKLGRDAGLVDPSVLRSFERLCSRLNELLPAEPPALVHGDLWTGNLYESSRGAVFIDPAVAYSHREADLAMSTLFGRFPSTFYTAYSEIFPPEPGWEQRAEIFNLYPLLVHVNLFGRSYLEEVLRIVRRYD